MRDSNIGSSLDFQSRGLGSIPKSRFKMDREKYKNSGLLKSPPIHLLLPVKIAKMMLNKWHYLGEVRGIIYALGHYEGCCVFTNCRSRIYESKHVKVIELARMVGKPGHKWAMSSLMSQCIKWLKQHTDYKLVITYADPYAGHNGMVYTAAGWIFDGVIGKDGHPLFIIDGKRISPRTLYDRHGTQSVPKMKQIYGNRLILESKPLKKRFIKYT